MPAPVSTPAGSLSMPLPGWWPCCSWGRRTGGSAVHAVSMLPCWQRATRCAHAVRRATQRRVGALPCRRCASSCTAPGPQTAWLSPLPPASCPDVRPVEPPRARTHNFGLSLFWCYWWPASFLVYPFLGRVWCAGGAHAEGPPRGVPACEGQRPCWRFCVCRLAWPGQGVVSLDAAVWVGTRGPGGLRNRTLQRPLVAATLTQRAPCPALQSAPS